MRIVKELSLLQVGDEFIIVDPDSEEVDLTSVHTLNESAADVWRWTERAGEFTAEDAARHLTEVYEVGYEEALRDVRELLQGWIGEGLISE